MKPNPDTKRLLQEIAAHCRENGLRFTDHRQLVMAIIAQSGQPIGAYDILAKFARSVDNPKPPTIYRALDFLLENGFIHKIESLNAFISCHAGHRHPGSQFMVCDDCGRVEEVHLCELPDPFQKKMSKTGFKLARWNIELHGSCGHCRS